MHRREEVAKLGQDRHSREEAGATEVPIERPKLRNEGKDSARLEHNQARLRRHESMVAALAVRPASSKDRHSKVKTAKGLRDRRVRLSAPTAMQFFDVQDRLGYDQPSKAVDWLIRKARTAIDELAPAEVLKQREELIPYSGGSRQELRTMPRETIRAARKPASPPEATCSATQMIKIPAAAPFQPPPAPEGAHPLVPDLFYLSQLSESHLPSAALLRHSAAAFLHPSPPSHHPPLPPLLFRLSLTTTSRRLCLLFRALLLRLLPTHLRCPRQSPSPRHPLLPSHRPIRFGIPIPFLLPPLISRSPQHFLVLLQPHSPRKPPSSTAFNHVHRGHPSVHV